MDTEDVDAAADPATDDNGEAEVAHGEAELKEAEDAAEEEELDPIAARAPRRRGGCGRLLCCCFILVMPALAVLANLFLHRPNPQHFASCRSSAVRRAEFATSWAVCDVLHSTPACGTILAPIAPEVWAQWEARATAKKGAGGRKDKRQEGGGAAAAPAWWPARAPRASACAGSS